MSNSGNLVNTGIKVLSPKMAFLKFFIITFASVLIAGAGCMYIVSSMLDKQVFDKGDARQGAEIGMLIPPEGMFTTDPEFVNPNRINILCLGTTKEKLSDTIMLVSYDQDTQDVDIISVPRDTYHAREGHMSPGEKKINAAYMGNPVDSAQAVHEVLGGIPINYYAEIDYKGVENIVDAIGGVEVDIPFDMNYERPHLKIHLKEGRQTLDGKDAVKFIRYRKGYRDGDMGRINTQQEFIKAAFKQSIGLNLPSVGKSVIDNVDSDLPLGTIISLASDVNKVDSESMSTYTIPGCPGMFESLSFYFCDGRQTEQMLRAIYAGQDFEATTSAISGPYDPNYYELGSTLSDKDSDE